MRVRACRHSRFARTCPSMYQDILALQLGHNRVNLKRAWSLGLSAVQTFVASWFGSMFVLLELRGSIAQ